MTPRRKGYKGASKAARALALMQAARRVKGANEVTLPMAPWDTGATGEANRRDLVEEEAAEIDPATGKRVNPNRVTRMRRVPPLERYWRDGRISERAYRAGLIIMDAVEATMKSPPAIQEVRVDSSPKPDSSIAVMVDRISRLVMVTRGIGAADRALVMDLICGTPIGPRYSGRRHGEAMARLRERLEALADRMGLS